MKRERERDLLNSLMHYSSIESTFRLSEYERTLVGHRPFRSDSCGWLGAFSLIWPCCDPSAFYHSKAIFIHLGFSLYAAAITNAFRQTNWSWVLIRTAQYPPFSSSSSISLFLSLYTYIRLPQQPKIVLLKKKILRILRDHWIAISKNIN